MYMDYAYKDFVIESFADGRSSDWELIELLFISL